MNLQEYLKANNATLEVDLAGKVILQVMAGGEELAIGTGDDPSSALSELHRKLSLSASPGDKLILNIPWDETD